MKFRNLYFLVVIGFVAMMVTGGVVAAQEKSDPDKPVLSEKKSHSLYKTEKPLKLLEKRGPLIKSNAEAKEYRSEDIREWRKKISWLKSQSKAKEYTPEDIREWRKKISWLKSQSKGEKYSKEEINHLKRIKSHMEGAVLSKD